MKPLLTQSPIKQIFICPWIVTSWSDKTWEALISQCYATSLMARVNWLLTQFNLIQHAPPSLKWHFEAAEKTFRSHLADVNREISAINKALKPTSVKPVYLKGAAYVATKDNVHNGRTFSDIDIYVPKSKIDTCEQVFLWSGWIGAEKDEYDQVYYREWMHEIPPLVNTGTGANLDVHHNLSPVISRFKINASILEDNIQAGKIENTYVLSPEDRLLHSAIHLLTGEEFYKSFRDLSDLDLMLREYSQQDDGFWDNLIQRAEKLGVMRILFYCLRYCSKILHTPIPERVLISTKKGSPSPFLLSFMDAIFMRALNPNHSTYKDNLYHAACFGLYLRSHWLKMPVSILIPHLYKKMKKHYEKDKNTDNTDIITENLN